VTQPTSSNYPGNSHKDRAPQTEEKTEKKVERVTEGKVIQRKKPLGRKLAETFTSEDAKSAGMFILMDVLVPAFKNMVSDAVSQGADRMLFGESRPSRSSQGSRTRHTPYDSLSRSSSISSQRNISRRGRTTHDFGEVVFDSRIEAENVLDRLTTIINQYDVATVSDLYELVGITGSYVDDKWGWSDLRGARVRLVREGYLLELPPTEPMT